MGYGEKDLGKVNFGKKNPKHQNQTMKPKTFKNNFSRALLFPTFLPHRGDLYLWRLFFFLCLPPSEKSQLNSGLLICPWISAKWKWKSNSPKGCKLFWGITKWSCRSFPRLPSFIALVRVCQFVQIHLSWIKLLREGKYGCLPKHILPFPCTGHWWGSHNSSSADWCSFMFSESPSFLSYCAVFCCGRVHCLHSR